MFKAVAVQAAGSWSDKPVDVVMLDSTERTWKSAPANDGIRRFSTISGVTIEIVPKTMPYVRTGDAFVTEKGGFVEIVGKPEALMEVRPEDDAALVRIAWQLGNHHMPMQILGKRIRLRQNTEIAAILTGLGAKITAMDAPFDPEGGAYLAAVDRHHHHHHHHHDDACGCGHDHAHAHHHDNTHRHGDHHHRHDEQNHHHDHKHGHADAHDNGHKHDHDHHGHACCGHDHKHK